MNAVLRRQRQGNRRRVHVSLRAACLLVLLFVRSRRLMAEFHKGLATKEAVMEKCLNLDCDRSQVPVGEGFCFNCHSTVLRDNHELFRDLDKVLHLEAQFTAYCADRGLQNPHE